MFSRQSKPEKKPVQIKLVVKEALALLQALIPDSVEMRENLCSNALVSADSNQIHQVVMNLCTDASYAVADKADGIIEIGLLEKSPQNLPESDTTGHFLELYVKDNGHGIPSKTIERIFEPFFTTKGKGEGSGLGLALVHGIIRSHGGRIEVESQPEQSTVFRIYLPIMEEPSTNLEDSRKSASGGNERILFVDDEPSITNMVKLILERFGYSVVCCNSSTEALSIFKSQPEQFDGIVTDMIMPGMTGLEMAREICKIRLKTPIILCSGCIEDFLLHEARSAGIRGFVRKPLLMHEIVTVLRKALDDASEFAEASGSPEKC
ncbi:hybrid sensor histidine kinase/response regulator [Desulfobacterium sp. N47]